MVEGCSAGFRLALAVAAVERAFAVAVAADSCAGQKVHPSDAAVVGTDPVAHEGTRVLEVDRIPFQVALRILAVGRTPFHSLVLHLVAQESHAHHRDLGNEAVAGIDSAGDLDSHIAVAVGMEVEDHGIAFVAVAVVGESAAAASAPRTAVFVSARPPLSAYARRELVEQRQ